MDSGTEMEGIADPKEEIGTEEANIVHRWKLELEAARKGPYARWLKRAKQSIRRYRDEDMDTEDGGPRRRNAQFNVLWSNIQTTAPSIYSRAPKPVAERRYLDRDVLARAAATILQRSLSYSIEDSGFHEAMMQCRTDFSLVGIGDAWLRYEAEYAPGQPQHQQDVPPAQVSLGAQAYAGDAAAPKVTSQRVCVDYCHWSDHLISACRFWGERTWRGKRAYYSRAQLKKLCGDADWVREIPLKVTRGKKENDVTDQIREVIGKAEVWQIWDIETREVLWICEDYGVRPLKHLKEDQLKVSGFVPSARPVRATTTNDSFWPIPDYTIWRDQASELDSLTARIAALTRAIKAVGVFDQSQPELERILQEGMENKLIGVKHWAKLVQRGGLEGSIGLLPIKEMADALTALYLARGQVKGDLYEISGVSDIVRGASDPDETAAAQKIKGQFSNVRGGDRKNEFNRFVRDTLVLMAEIMLEHFTADMLWQMSDFEQWVKDQDLRAYAPDQPPGMGHNGGPPLDGMAPAMAPSQPLMPTAAAPDPMAMASPASSIPGDQVEAAAPQAAPSPISPTVRPQAPVMPPPVPGIQMAMQPAEPQPINPRQLFDDALQLLRDDKLRSFRIMVETNSTIEPDMQQEQARRNEFLATVTAFLKNAQDMAAAYPALMPVMGKMLLFGCRGYSVSRELESSLEGMIADLEAQARNPKPKPPSAEEIKAKAIDQKAQADMATAKMKAEGEQQRFQMELQKMREELMAERERMQMELQHLQAKFALEMEALQAKIAAEREALQIKREGAQLDAAIKQREMAMNMEAQDHQAEIDHEMREGEAQAAREGIDIKREGLDVQREGLALKRQAAQAKAKSDKSANWARK